MGSVYRLRVECRFSASHVLPGCPPCDRLHGHSWRLRGTWMFLALDETGMGANFALLRQLLEERIVRVYDHRHLNDVPPFDAVAPTAENLAREFYRMLKGHPRVGGNLRTIELWEGSENSVVYEEGTC